MHQFGQMSPIFSITIAVMGILLLIFALLSEGLVSYPAFLGMFFMAFGSLTFIWTKRSARGVSRSD